MSHKKTSKDSLDKMENTERHRTLMMSAVYPRTLNLSSKKALCECEFETDAKGYADFKKCFEFDVS